MTISPTDPIIKAFPHAEEQGAPAKNISEDPLVTEAKNKWLNRVNELPVGSRNHFKEQIELTARKIAQQLSEISHLKNSANTTSRHSQHLVQLMHIESEAYFNRYKVYTAKKEAANHSFYTLTNKVQNAQITFDSFSPPPKSSMRPVRSFAEWVAEAEFHERQQHFYTEMLVMKCIATVIKVASPKKFLVSTAKKYLVTQTVSAVCNKKQLSQQECHKLEEGVLKAQKDLSNLAKNKTILFLSEERLKQDKERLSKFWADYYNVPLEMTSEHVENSIEVYTTTAKLIAGMILKYIPR